MKLQAKISARRLKAKVGSVQTVLVDALNGDIATARSTGDAPEIDGTVIIRDAAALKVGEFEQVRVLKAGKYDLHAVPLGAQ